MRDPQLGAVVRHIRRLALPHDTQTLTDVQLLERFAQRREESAFAALMQRHGRLVWGVCRHLLRQEQDAEDAFQATFLVLARNPASIRKGEALASWLHGTAFRIALCTRRDAGRRRACEAKLPPAAGATPPSEGAWQELQAALDEEVQRLPPRQRAAFVLCALEGKSQPEAAAALGWKLGTVASTLARARQHLRCRLAARGITLSALLAGIALAERDAGAAPAALTSATLQAALAGGAPATVSARVADLVRGALHEAAPLKLKLLAALVALAAVVGGGLALRPTPQAPPAPAEAAEAAAPGPDGADEDRAEAAAESPLPAGALTRLGTSRFRHAYIVPCIAFAPDGKVLASGSFRGTVRFWEVGTGKEQRVLTAHNGGVVSMVFSPDGKVLATGSWDRLIRLWDVAKAEPIRELTGHGGEVTTLAFSPDGKVLASSSRDGTARLWEAASGKPLSTIAAHDGEVRHVAFSPDGKRLATAGIDKFVYVWDAESGKKLATCEGHTNQVESVAFSPDGKSLASCGRDTTLRLWDSQTGKQTRSIKHASWLRKAVFSPDGKFLAVAGDWGGKVYLWDLTAAGDKPRWVAPQPMSLAVAFSPDGRKLAGAAWECAVRLWDVATGKEEGAAPAGGHTGWVSAVAALPDRKTVVSAGSEGAVIVWDAVRGREVRRLVGHGERVQCLAAAPDGKTIASGGRDQTVRLWDVAAGREVAKIQAGGSVRGLAFAPDGKRLASASGNDLYDGWVLEVPGHGAAVWEVTTAKPLFRLEGHEGGVKAVAYSPDGKTLATGGNDHSVRLWDAATGKELRRLEGHTGAVEAVAFSPDGKRLASAGQDGVARLWRLDGGDTPTPLGGANGWLLAIAFSPDGRTLITAARDDGNTKVALRLWDVATGKERARYTGHQGTAAAAAFAPGGRVLVTGGGDGAVLLWDLTGRVENGKFATADLSPLGLEGAWADLVADDDLKAHKALWALVAAPKQSLPLLRDVLKPAPAGDAARIARLVKELDDDDFEVRERASADLDRIGEPAEKALRKALEGTPSAELRTRAARLLEKFSGQVLSSDALRRQRALEVLEQVGGAEARALLREIAAGAPEAGLTQEAKAALKRLDRE
jgi:RNA polymerase sigma factor (sigma-70 family)